jgi:hypothetical protein
MEKEQLEKLIEDKVRRAKKLKPYYPNKGKKMISSKTADWITHVKEKQKELGIKTYKEALSDPRVKSSYKKAEIVEIDTPKAKMAKIVKVEANPLLKKKKVALQDMKEEDAEKEAFRISLKKLYKKLNKLSKDLNK